ncbi:30S ribosomal protein S4 [Candidatus Micrarchaeota archaeon]|nr:MAG: 30S ribosomal protein S4 [Candidatus Micrarchaeota archaeon]
MGDPRRFRKKYESPKHPWEKSRIEEENKIRKEYALKSKKEIWRAKTIIKKYRHQARQLVGLPANERAEKEKKLIEKLQKIGLLGSSATLDDILSLKVEDLLERRLQTIVWKKGLARTAKQARQFIVHGHIAVNGRKVTVPGMIIDTELEKKVTWYKKPIITETAKIETIEPSETIEKIAEEAGETEQEKEAAEEILKTSGKSETIKHIAKEGGK